MSGSTVWPGDTLRRTTSRPDAATIAANRSPNAPLTSDRARCRTPDRTAISMKPVAEQVPTSTRRWLRNSCCSGCTIPPARGGGGDEPPPPPPPLPQQPLGLLGVNRLHRVGDRIESGVGPALEQALDGGLVAHVQGPAVKHDPPRLH